LRIGGTFKTYETAQKAARPIRRDGYKVDVKPLAKGYGLYKYNS